MTRITLTIKDKSKAEELLKQLRKNHSVEIESIIDEDKIDHALLASEEAINYGNTISQQDLENEIESWRNK